MNVLYWIGHEEYGKQSINDGKLEVVALYSSFHMAQLQVGLSQPYRLGQANSIKVFQSLFKSTDRAFKKI